ncbi:MAG: hypothetical protein COC01_07280 [Bacteroidetes bacterium]|nr:MAG: hypothetical protein COC01_07280 [Bacteroidota bacterium]
MLGKKQEQQEKCNNNRNENIAVLVFYETIFRQSIKELVIIGGDPGKILPLIYSLVRQISINYFKIISGHLIWILIFYEVYQ